MDDISVFNISSGVRTMENNDEIVAVDEYYGKKVLYGVVFTSLIVVMTIPPILIGILADSSPSSGYVDFKTALIISGSITGAMLLLQYYPIHRAIFRGIPTRRSAEGEGSTFLSVSLMAMIACIIDISWSAASVGSDGTTIGKIALAYSVISMLISSLCCILDFVIVMMYASRY